MTEEKVITHWQTFLNFVYLLNIYNIPSDLKNILIYLINEIDRKKYNYLDNYSDMLIDDNHILIEYDNIFRMEDGNEEYFVFQCNKNRICIYQCIGTKVRINCGYFSNYPEQIIPFLIKILNLIFQELKFTEKSGLIQIWNLRPIHMHFIQYLFLNIRNIQNHNFDFEKYENSDVSDRSRNEFSAMNKRKIRELANNCCESCGEYILNGEIDHINEHQFGGTNNTEDGQYICHFCHSKKTAINRLVKRVKVVV